MAKCDSLGDDRIVLKKGKIALEFPQGIKHVWFSRNKAEGD